MCIKKILFFLILWGIISACSETDPDVPVIEVPEIEKTLPQVKAEVVEVNQRNVQLEISLTTGKYTELTGLKLCYVEGTTAADTTHRVVDLYAAYQQNPASQVVTLENLKAATEYSYRLYLENSDNQDYSKLQYFITKTPKSDTSWEYVGDLSHPSLYLPGGFALSNRFFALSSYCDEDQPGGDLVEYSLITKKWLPAKETPLKKHLYPICITLDDKLFVGFGEKINESVPTTWWCYDLTTDSWTRKADIPHTYVYNVMGTFVYKEFIYAVYTRSMTDSSVPIYVVAYNTKTDEWISKNDFIGKKTTGSATFVLNDKAYFIGGLGGWVDDAPLYRSEVWEYDIIQDQWIRKNDFPSKTLEKLIGLNRGGVGYAGFGQRNNANHNGSYSDPTWWQYEPEQDEWYACNTYTGWTINHVPDYGFVVDNDIYIGAQYGGLWKCLGE